MNTLLEVTFIMVGVTIMSVIIFACVCFWVITFFIIKDKVKAWRERNGR